MQKLIPSIYFYVLSAIGMVLIIIGLFNAIHYLVGVTIYEKYPLQYGTEYDRCEYRPEPMPLEGAKQPELPSKEACYKGLENEREQKKVSDIENALSFGLIGLFVFTTHFYFARRQKTA